MVRKSIVLISLIKPVVHFSVVTLSENFQYIQHYYWSSVGREDAEGTIICKFWGVSAE